MSDPGAMRKGPQDSRDKDVARFGRWADSYNESALQRLFFAPLQEFTLQQAATILPQPKAVLDIGCGTGLLLQRAARHFPSAELTGVDPAEEMIRVARASVPEGEAVRFVHGFAEELPFAPASFDLVLTTMSFHHWADQTKALGEVRRVLVAGGLFALTDIVPPGWLHRLGATGGHSHVHGRTALAGMLQDAGLHPQEAVPVPWTGHVVRVVLARAASR